MTTNNDPQKEPVTAGSVLSDRLGRTGRKQPLSGPGNRRNFDDLTPWI